MGNYQGYQKYKDSGVEWLGDIPEHWEVKRLRYIGKFINGFSFNSNAFTKIGVRVLKISNIQHMRIDWSDSSFIDEEYYETASTFRVYKNDLVFALTRPIISTGIKAALIDTNEKILINQRNCIFRTQQEMSNKWIYYILLCSSFIKEFDLRIDRTGQQPNISSNDIANIYIPISPLNEQEKIAQFLDYKTKQIDELIKKKETLIEKLDEKRTAIISHAVTKGLDSSVPMKDSGVEWLGDIPKHWEVKRLRYIGSCQNGISKGADYFGFGYPFVNYTDVYANIELPKTVSGLANSTDMDRINYSVQKGDIFFTRTSETIEEIGITSTCFNSINNATFSGFLIRVRPFPNLLFTGFSKYYFRCQLHRLFFVKEMNLVTRASLSQELLKRLPVLLPTIEEQKQISKHLDQKTAQIDQQKAKIKQAIELLKEYRTSLITNAVTGKIDVSQIAVP